MFIQALNRNLDLQPFEVLYISGNYSGILSKLDRRFEALEIRRAFTCFQLMTILEEAHHSIIIVEHDPCSTRTPQRWSSMSPMPGATRSPTPSFPQA